MTDRPPTPPPTVEPERRRQIQKFCEDGCVGVHDVNCDQSSDNVEEWCWPCRAGMLLSALAAAEARQQELAAEHARRLVVTESYQIEQEHRRAAEQQVTELREALVAQVEHYVSGTYREDWGDGLLPRIRALLARTAPSSGETK